MTVDGNGKIKAVAEGTAVITAAAEDGGKTDSCTVTVKRSAKDNGSDTSKPDASKPGAAPKDSVKTGDATDVSFYLLLMIAAIGGITVSFSKRKIDK